MGIGTENADVNSGAGSGGTGGGASGSGGGAGNSGGTSGTGGNSSSGSCAQAGQQAGDPASTCPTGPDHDQSQKVSKCMVQFRPKDDWKGEFGFDWLRIGGAGEKAGEVDYKSIIKGGYKSGPPIVEYTPDEAYSALKYEYWPYNLQPVITSPPEGKAEYFIPYLNLYPSNAPETDPTPPSTASLKVLIEVQDLAPDKIELEYDTSLFVLNWGGPVSYGYLDQPTLALTDTAIGPKRNVSDGGGILSITCNAEFDTDQEIKVWFYSQGLPKQQCGELIVCANSAANRKSAKIVFVKVQTNIDGRTPQTGSFTDDQKQHLTKSLHQALIHGAIEDSPNNLDLTDPTVNPNHRDFETGGKFINADGSINLFHQNNSLPDTDPNKSDIFPTVRNLFLSQPGNDVYQDGYFTVFSFNEAGPNGVDGSIQYMGIHNLFLLNPATLGVISHEFIHGLGLWHTHFDAPDPSDPDSSNRKYFYVLHKTDNIMSYADPNLDTLWHWQWQIMKSGL